MVAMFSHAPSVDENVINVDEDDSMEILPENLMHETLEYRGSLTNPYGITRYSLWPVGVTKAVFHSLPRVSG